MNEYLKDPVSGFLHVAGFILAVVGAGVLLGRARGPLLVVVIYVVALVALYAASAIYHLMPAGERLSRALRVVDHVAISFFVAASSTPLLFRALDGTPRLVSLVVIWGLALVAALVKLAWTTAPRIVYTAMYLTMGWSMLFALHTLPTTLLALVLGGGIAYTFGAVIYARTTYRFWHSFVLVGSALHFVAIASL
jgi:hemolysin III